MKVITQVLDALIGQIPVEMPPRKLLFHITTGFQRLNGEFSVTSCMILTIVQHLQSIPSPDVFMNTRTYQGCVGNKNLERDKSSRAQGKVTALLPFGEKIQGYHTEVITASKIELRDRGQQKNNLLRSVGNNKSKRKWRKSAKWENNCNRKEAANARQGLTMFIHSYAIISCAPIPTGWPLPLYLHGFHDMEVGHVLVNELRVLRHVDIFLGHHHSLLKKEFVDGNSVLLGHQHLNKR